MTLPGQPTKPWTAEDLQKLRALAGERSWDEIAAELGRSVSSCKGKWQWECTRAARELAARAPTVRTWRGRDIAMEAAREAREAAAAPQSLTALFCGDPLPGRSALDQKLAAQPPRGITLPTAGISL